MFGLQLGFLSTYLSEPIVKAFTSAAAFHVTVSQLQSMLGLRLPRHTGPFSLFKVSRASHAPVQRAVLRRCLLTADVCTQTLASVMENLPDTNLAELLISLLCLAVLVPVKEVNVRYRQRLRTPIPVEILTVRRSTSSECRVHMKQVYGTINMVSRFVLQVIVATGVAYASSLDSAYNVEIVGHIPAG